jgi:hypothetical protein
MGSLCLKDVEVSFMIVLFLRVLARAIKASGHGGRG